MMIRLWILKGSIRLAELKRLIGDSVDSSSIQAVKLESLLGFTKQFLTDPSIENRGCDCIAPLECILNIVRALRMGSCLSAESRRSPLPGSPLSPAVGFRKRRNSKKRLGSRSSSFEYRRDEPLHRIPGRLFLNGSSEVASLFTQQGKKGTNQDAMIVWEVISSSSCHAINSFWSKL